MTLHRAKKPVFYRLLRRVKVVGNCWVWTGYVNKNGYGRIDINYNSVYTHRASYEFFVGKIPKDKQLDHLCRNRKCLNPEHLEVVTNRENILRGVSFAAKNARKKRCKRGHPLEGQNLHIRKDGRGRECVKCRTQAVYKYKGSKLYNLKN